MEYQLNQIKKNEEVIVQRVEGSGELRYHLLEMGIIKGTIIRLSRVAPLGDPIEISVQGFNLSLRKEEAALIIVKKCKPKKGSL